MGERMQKWYTKAGSALFLLMLLVVTVIANNHLSKFEKSGHSYGSDGQQLAMIENM
jgi:hypothetical protein